MVTTPHYLASGAGLDVLRHGGNAVEAAIAASAVLAVVYPQMCTLGGDAFWLVWDASQKKLAGINASGRAGLGASREAYLERGRRRIPARGWLACNTVPGLVSGWEKAWELALGMRGHAMGGLSWPSLFEDALAYCHEGFPVSSSLAFWLKADTAPAGPRLQQDPGFARCFLPDGRLPGEGEVLRQPDLGATLERIVRHGPHEFYEGSIAARIASAMQARGGLLALADFQRHRADFVEPLRVGYRGFEACNLPPNTQGMASLGILNILEHFDVQALGEGTADYCHLLVEATKLAFADRDRWLTDPDFQDIPLDRLLSRAHGREQAALVDMARARPFANPLDPAGDTVWFGTMDRWGNAVSLIQSVYYDFGSGIVPEGTGVLLQNRGCYFSLDQRHVNCLEPGKRTFHTLNPAMLLKDGRPWLVYGTMGGEGQPQTQAAVVTRIVDFGMSPQAAVDAPRWVYGRTWGADASSLRLESRIGQDVARELARRGHELAPADDYDSAMGHAGCILADPVSGLLRGAADPRSDGLACGW
ncbi:MAG: gamma-glutamyltransferase [Desulfovibrio sp.]|nr:gamma-glutamyltransferase [Desulfovibrio sp.]